MLNCQRGYFSKGFFNDVNVIRFIEPNFLNERDEKLRGDIHMVRITPSRQDFNTDNFFISNANNGLIIYADRIAFDRPDQRSLQRKTVFVESDGKKRERCSDESQNG